MKLDARRHPCPTRPIRPTRPPLQALAAKLEALLDRLAEGVGGERVAELRALYVRAMELELAFFDAWSA